MLAICGNDALREFSSPGKSGSFFYLTQDDRFMIKTVKKSEVKVSCFHFSHYDARLIVHLGIGVICVMLVTSVSYLGCRLLPELGKMYCKAIKLKFTSASSGAYQDACELLSACLPLSRFTCDQVFWCALYQAHWWAKGTHH